MLYFRCQLLQVGPHFNLHVEDNQNDVEAGLNLGTLGKKTLGQFFFYQ